MRPKAILAAFMCLLSLTCSMSCKKEGSGNNVTVTYAFTWTSTLTQGSTLEVGYVNSAAGKLQMDFNLSGSGWTKTVTIQNPANPLILSLVAVLNVQQPGTIEGKIYVNGVLKSDKVQNFQSAGAVGYNCNFGQNWTYTE